MKVKGGLNGENKEGSRESEEEMGYVGIEEWDIVISYLMQYADNEVLRKEKRKTQKKKGNRRSKKFHEQSDGP